MTEKLTIGNLGEDEACRFLKNKGYEILERNWRFDHKEIDIIARKNDELVFVEVKTRNKNSPESPIDAVTLKKQQLLIEAAEFYVQKNDLDLEIRFDIISILHYQHNVVSIEHFENAFLSEL